MAVFAASSWSKVRIVKIRQQVDTTLRKSIVIFLAKNCMGEDDTLRIWVKSRSWSFPVILCIRACSVKLWSSVVSSCFAGDWK